MGKGESHDLRGVGGVRQELLISGHGGIETDLAFGGADGAKAFAQENSAIGEHKGAGGGGGASRFSQSGSGIGCAGRGVKSGSRALAPQGCWRVRPDPAAKVNLVSAM